MSVKKALSFAGLGVLAAVWAVPAQAGTKMQGNVVPYAPPSNTTSNYEIKDNKPGKFAVKESKKDGDGGAVLQLKVKGMDCVDGTELLCTEDEDCPEDLICASGLCRTKGEVFKCTEADHTLILWSSFSGLFTVTPVKFDLVDGKSIFPSTGKNKTGTGAVFGALATAIMGNPLGIGFIEITGPATVASGGPCDPPILPGNPISYPGTASKTTCIDGERYAVSGIIGGVDVLATCAGDDTLCADTQICNTPICETDPCTQDSECRCFGDPPGCGDTVVTCDEVKSECCDNALGGDCDID